MEKLLALDGSPGIPSKFHIRKRKGTNNGNEESVGGGTSNILIIQKMYGWIQFLSIFLDKRPRTDEEENASGSEGQNNSDGGGQGGEEVGEITTATQEGAYGRSTQIQKFPQTVSPTMIVWGRNEGLPFYSYVFIKTQFYLKH